MCTFLPTWEQDFPRSIHSPIIVWQMFAFSISRSFESSFIESFEIIKTFSLGITIFCWGVLRKFFFALKLKPICCLNFLDKIYFLVLKRDIGNNNFHEEVFLLKYMNYLQFNFLITSDTFNKRDEKFILKLLIWKFSIQIIPSNSFLSSTSSSFSYNQFIIPFLSLSFNNLQTNWSCK